MYKLTYAQSYHEDVKSVVNYIKNSLQNPIAAQKLKDDLKTKNKKIKENPFMYPAVPDEFLASKGYRFAMVNNFMIFYKVKEKQIEVIRFLYGYRDWINIIGKEN
ncbi:MAG: type II toxin-antitoxin system RelE/ParE family toxin [Treponema sp.]|nr:type II toxin-antitoxin system RelE/ParE family toxin [Treponema sp.]